MQKDTEYEKLEEVAEEAKTRRGLPAAARRETMTAAEIRVASAPLELNAVLRDVLTTEEQHYLQETLDDIQRLFEDGLGVPPPVRGEQGELPI